MKKILMIVGVIGVVVVSLLASHNSDYACSVTGVPTATQICVEADDIVCATAVDYTEAPVGNGWTTGVPESKISFKVEEVVKGDTALHNFILNGYLSDKDDFNDGSVPYGFVRRNGRAGSCFANTYKRGAQFLLFLKDSKNVKWPGITTPLTVDFAALAPVNEELHSSDDPWLFYIEGVVAGLAEAGKLKK